MTTYSASVHWQRDDQQFLDNQYRRAFIMRFDGGVDVAGSSSPSVVPVPLSDPSAVDPEEAFIASLSGCHMLWFLSLAAKQQFRVDSYDDAATGRMARNDDGRYYMSEVTLKPRVVFSGFHIPTRHDVETLHHEAHRECFIANSVRTTVRCEPIFNA